jgi:hypothetical protein
MKFANATTRHRKRLTLHRRLLDIGADRPRHHQDWKRPNLFCCYFPVAHVSAPRQLLRRQAASESHPLPKRQEMRHPHRVVHSVS